MRGRRTGPVGLLRRPGAGRLLAGGGLVISGQLGDNLPGDLQPLQFLLGVGGLLAHVSGTTTESGMRGLRMYAAR